MRAGISKNRTLSFNLLEGKGKETMEFKPLALKTLRIVYK